MVHGPWPMLHQPLCEMDMSHLGSRPRCSSATRLSAWPLSSPLAARLRPRRSSRAANTSALAGLDCQALCSRITLNGATQPKPNLSQPAMDKPFALGPTPLRPQSCHLPTFQALDGGCASPSNPSCDSWLPPFTRPIHACLVQPSLVVAPLATRLLCHRLLRLSALLGTHGTTGQHRSAPTRSTALLRCCADCHARPQPPTTTHNHPQLDSARHLTPHLPTYPQPPLPLVCVSTSRPCHRPPPTCPALLQISPHLAPASRVSHVIPSRQLRPPLLRFLEKSAQPTLT
jgi:hypothetical protein